MKKIDSLAAGLIRGFHIYNDVILGILLTALGTGLFAMSFSIKLMKEPVSAVDTPASSPSWCSAPSSPSVWCSSSGAS